MVWVVVVSRGFCLLVVWVVEVSRGFCLLVVWVVAVSRGSISLCLDGCRVRRRVRWCGSLKCHRGTYLLLIVF